MDNILFIRNIKIFMLNYIAFISATITCLPDWSSIFCIFHILDSAKRGICDNRQKVMQKQSISASADSYDGK